VRRAIVALDGRRAGVLSEIEEGTSFTYDAGWSGPPVSLTMPVRGEPYVGRGLLPFFENLLPEGWLLEIATSKLKITKDDAFGLLLATGADCPGAVEIRPEPS
jgi:serine/threonine-protein kinase HipA